MPGRTNDHVLVRRMPSSQTNAHCNRNRWNGRFKMNELVKTIHGDANLPRRVFFRPYRDLGGRAVVLPSPEGLGYCLSSLPGLRPAFTLGGTNVCLFINVETSSWAITVRSKGTRLVFRHLTLISKHSCAAGYMIDNLWLGDQSNPRIAWEKNTNRH